MSIPLAGGQHSHGFLVKLVSPLTNPPKFTFIINPSGLDPREDDENPEGIAAEFRRAHPKRSTGLCLKWGLNLCKTNGLARVGPLFKQRLDRNRFSVDTLAVAPPSCMLKKLQITHKLTTSLAIRFQEARRHDHKIE